MLIRNAPFPAFVVTINLPTIFIGVNWRTAVCWRFWLRRRWGRGSYIGICL
jgi:hypothetical protein